MRKTIVPSLPTSTFSPWIVLPTSRKVFDVRAGVVDEAGGGSGARYGLRPTTSDPIGGFVARRTRTFNGSGESRPVRAIRCASDLGRAVADAPPLAWADGPRVRADLRAARAGAERLRARGVLAALVGALRVQAFGAAASAA